MLQTLLIYLFYQWCTRTGGGAGGGGTVPQRLSMGKFLLTNWEKQGKEKRLIFFFKLANIEENEKNGKGPEENKKCLGGKFRKD